jgi:cytochrome bd-type quinol oxidase subunit 2
MITNLKKVLLTAISVSILTMPALVPAAVYADIGPNTISGGICSGTNASTATNGQCDTGTANSQISTLMTDVINLFSLLVGIVSVIMIIIGGFKYITSNGDTGNISSAKNTIIFALVGLVIVAMAQFIVHFVLGKVAGIQS